MRLKILLDTYAGCNAGPALTDAATNAWRRARDMPTPRHGMGAVTIGGTIYVIGGGSVAGFGASRANEAFSRP